MISCVFGLCGSGKSLLLAKIIDRVMHGKSANFHGLHVSSHKHYNRIYTNFLFKDCYKLDFERLGYYDYHDCLIVIDEIMLLADCRNFKTYGENLKLFFSQHRKKNIDIIYATQAFDDVDKKIRNVTDSLYYVDDWYFNCMRVRRIKHCFSVATCSTSYEFTAPCDNVYLYRSKLYSLVDSYELIVADKSKYFNETPPPIMW